MSRLISVRTVWLVALLFVEVSCASAQTAQLATRSTTQPKLRPTTRAATQPVRVSPKQRTYVGLVSPMTKSWSEVGDSLVATGVVISNERQYLTRNGQDGWWHVTSIVTVNHGLTAEAKKKGYMTVRRLDCVDPLGYTETDAKITHVFWNADLAILTIEREDAPFMPETIPFLLGEIPEGWVHLCGSADANQGTFSTGEYMKGRHEFTENIGFGPVTVPTDLLTTCYTQPGASGGPFFVEKDGVIYCVGMVTHVLTEDRVLNGDVTVPTGSAFGFRSDQIRYFARRDKVDHLFTFKRLPTTQPGVLATAK
ncbi:serine protease [Candidatus Parcubacteria bacterium]|nr:serine protease [Candidatus Parcubacteria bacterium]